MQRRSFIALGLAAATTIAIGSAVAQSFPDKPITMIIAFPAGGGTDVAGRLVASIAEKSIGQPIVILNKAGAGGQIGWTDLARARPDGYTIGFINLPATHTAHLDPARKAVFNGDSFVPVINQVLDPGVAWVKADSPLKTFKDLLDAAKKAPGTIRAATTGILSDDHLAILMTEEAAPGVTFRIVHLDGGATQLKEVLGGNVDVAFDNVGGITKQVQAGQVRPLAVFDKERSRFLPDVPTTVELGYPTILSSSTRGIAVPKGTPEPVIAKLREHLERAMNDADHVKRLNDQGLAIKVMVGDEYAQYYKDNLAQAKKYTEWARSRPSK